MSSTELDSTLSAEIITKSIETSRPSNNFWPCLEPVIPAHSSLSGKSTLSGRHLSLTCDSGYHRSSGRNSLTCLQNGSWNGSLPSCAKDHTLLIVLVILFFTATPTIVYFAIDFCNYKKKRRISAERRSRKNLCGRISFVCQSRVSSASLWKDIYSGSQASNRNVRLPPLSPINEANINLPMVDICQTKYSQKLPNIPTGSSTMLADDILTCTAEPKGPATVSHGFPGGVPSSVDADSRDTHNSMMIVSGDPHSKLMGLVDPIEKPNKPKRKKKRFNVAAMKSAERPRTMQHSETIGPNITSDEKSVSSTDLKATSTAIQSLDSKDEYCLVDIHKCDIENDIEGSSDMLYSKEHLVHKSDESLA